MDDQLKHRKKPRRVRRDKHTKFRSPYSLKERIGMWRSDRALKKKLRKAHKKNQRKHKKEIQNERLLNKRPISTSERNEKRQIRILKKKVREAKREQRRKKLKRFFTTLFTKKQKTEKEIKLESKIKRERKRIRKKRFIEAFTDPFGRKRRRKMYPTLIDMTREIKQLRTIEVSEEMRELARNPLGIEELSENDKRSIRRAKEAIKEERVRMRKLFFKNPIAYIRKYHKRGITFQKERLKDRLNARKEQAISYFSEKENIKIHLGLIINSTSVFILAYLFVYFFSQFVTIFTASQFDISTELFYFGLDWPLATYSIKYTETALVIIFASAPLVALLSGALLFQLFKAFRGIAGYMKLFILWSSIHFFNLFFGAFTAGAISRTGFIYAIEWAFKTAPMDVFETTVLVVVLIISFFIAKSFTYPFLCASNSRNLVKPNVRWMYLISQAIIPWIIGTIIIMISLIPSAPLSALMLTPLMAFLVVPIMSNINTAENETVNLPFRRIRTKPRWLLLIFSIALVIILKVIFEGGIRF